MPRTRIKIHPGGPTYPWQAPPIIDTNAGIPYCFPWEPPFFRGNRQNVAQMPTTFLALTPDTLPPNIDGIAWWYPFDQPPRKQTKVYIQQTEMVLLIPGTLPVGIAGSAWNLGWEPPYFAKRTKPYIHPQPAYGTGAFLPAPISGMAWYQQFDQPKRKKVDVWLMPAPTITYARSPWKGYYTVKISGGAR